MMLAIRLLAAVAIVAVIVRLLQRRKAPVASDAPPASGAPSASDSPDLWASMHAHFEQQDRELEQARHWSDGEIRLAVEQYVFKLSHSEDDVDDWLAKLRQQPDKAAREALRQAEDPDLQSRLRKEPKGQPALYRACQVMMLAPRAAAAPQIERLLAAHQAEVRHDALRWLAQVADPAHADALVEALRGGDPGALHPVLAGLLDGQLERADGPDHEFADHLFEPVADALQGLEDARGIDLAARVLLRWDADKAHQQFELTGWLRAGHEALPATLDAMRAEGRRLPRETLLAMWQELDSRDAPRAPATAVLMMLASHRAPEDLDLLQEVFARPTPAAAAAAEALLAFHGLAQWRTALPAGDEAPGPAEAQAALALLSYDGNVSTGGHGSFFFHASGDGWRTALAAMESAQDIPRREILREALARFAEPPSTDRETRQAQLATLTRARDAVFEDLDQRYRALEVPIDVAVAKLVLANPDAFRTRR